MAEPRFQRMKLADLIPAEYNPRKDLKPGDREWERIDNSIEHFGMVEPIVYNERTGRIVGGHQRCKILAHRGEEMVDVSVVDLDEKQERILCVRLNKIKGFWDSEKLADLLTEIKEATGSIETTGFEEWELDSLTRQYDHIENLLEDDFSDLGSSESDTFAITFTFPLDCKGCMDEFIEDNGKDALVSIVMTQVTGGEEEC